jgi:uncharacterized protein YkwD
MARFCCGRVADQAVSGAADDLTRLWAGQTRCVHALLLFPRTESAVSEGMKPTLLLITALVLFVETQGWSPAVPGRQINDDAMEHHRQLQQQPSLQYSETLPQPNSPNRKQAREAVRDPHCPGNEKPALMCRLVNQYREKNGLKPVQLDAAVSREAQYWSDQLDRHNACWFLYHEYNYRERMRARFPGRRFRENAACSGSTGGGAEFILQKWIDSAGHRENMLTPQWKTIGVGVTNNIWVIDFTD